MTSLEKFCECILMKIYFGTQSQIFYHFFKNRERYENINLIFKNKRMYVSVRAYV